MPPCSHSARRSGISSRAAISQQFGSTVICPTAYGVIAVSRQLVVDDTWLGLCNLCHLRIQGSKSVCVFGSAVYCAIDDKIAFIRDRAELVVICLAVVLLLDWLVSGHDGDMVATMSLVVKSSTELSIVIKPSERGWLTVWRRPVIIRPISCSSILS